MKILIIDNYDSFTYNLLHLVQEAGNHSVTIFRNDQIDIKEVNNFDKIILSPGPGLPKDAGFMPKIIEDYHTIKPILGVCLGHQGLCEFFGAQLFNLPKVLHGIDSSIQILDTAEPLFKGIPNLSPIGHYHSWAVSKLNFPSDLKITATTLDGTVMAMRHHTYDVCGVQFHPESVLTAFGKQMMENWIHS